MVDESENKFRLGTGTFDGTSTGDLTLTTGTLLSNLEGNVNGLDLQSELDLKAPINNPTFTGTVSGVTKAMVGLSNDKYF